MTEEQLAAAAVWLDQYAAASERLKENAGEYLRTGWLTFEAWYSTAAVMAHARAMSEVSTLAQQQIAGLAAEYVRQLLAVLGAPAPVRRPDQPTVRNGADLQLVHSRPAETYKRAIAIGVEPEDAVDRATSRALGLVRTDLSLVEREVEQGQMEQAGIQRFRRVIRPELSESGSCGLCVVASDRIYHVKDLMPIHPPWCKCKTMPITEAEDPGVRINREDLERLYAAAGSTSGDDLKRIRVKVNQHGELGPILGEARDSFRNQKQVPLEADPARAARMLEKTLPVLERLERRAGTGEDVSGPLAYQQGLVERLRRIAA